MGFALKQRNEEIGKFEAVCKCKVDPANPDLTCNSKLTMPDGSTSSIRHHIRTKHPTEWIRLLTEENTKAEQEVLNNWKLARSWLNWKAIQMNWKRI